MAAPAEDLDVVGDGCTKVEVMIVASTGIPPGDDDDEPEEVLECTLMNRVFATACAIADFKFELMWLVEDVRGFKTWRNREDATRALRQQVGNRPADMVDLLYTGLKAPESSEEAQDHDVSEAGFVDRHHMARMFEAFFRPRFVIEGEDKERKRDALIKATGFVHRLWDVRRILDVYFDHSLDAKARSATMDGMLDRLDRLLEHRTWTQGLI